MDSHWLLVIRSNISAAGKQFISFKKIYEKEKYCTKRATNKMNKFGIEKWNALDSKVEKIEDQFAENRKQLKPNRSFYSVYA